MMASCPGSAGAHARWTARSLAGAFLDLALVYACLCAAAAASAASLLLALFGLPLPCTCSRPHLPCLLAFLARYPSRALDSLLTSLRSHFPFIISSDDQEEEAVDEGGGEEAEDLRRELGEEREARAALQRELEKERSAAASAAEEAMSMILRLQKEKSALEIEARQQRRTADERCAFYEDEVEELKDIVLMREREARALQKEVDAYRRLLGLAGEDEEGEEEMVTPRNIVLGGEPSSSKSVDKNGGNDGLVQLGNDSAFSFKTTNLREGLMSPIHEDRMADKTLGKVRMVGSKMGVDSCDDDGAETVEILPLSARSLDFPLSARSLDFPQSARSLDFPQSARSLDFSQSARSLDQCGDCEVDAAPGMEGTEELLSDEFQEVECGGTDKIDHNLAGSENDAHIYDVHVIDDICFSTEVKGLIGRSFSDATMQAEKLQNRAAADDLLGRSLNAIKGAQDKIRLAASERRQSLQLQLLEDIANQLQEIKDAAEAGQHLYCASPSSKKS